MTDDLDEDFCGGCNYPLSVCICEDDAGGDGDLPLRTFGFCSDPDCIMQGEHLVPDECHTAQMMEDYCRASEQERAVRERRR